MGVTSLFDVVIVGAGVAGLAAARELVASGVKVAILEARNRIGGRIQTLHIDSSLSVELGAEFIHGESPQLLEVIHAAGLRLDEVPQDHRFIRSGIVQDRHKEMNTVWQLLDKMHASPEHDFSFRQFLDQHNPDPETREWARAYVEGFNAADQNRIGVYALVRQQEAEEQINGEKSFRLPDGYDHVPGALFHSVESAVSLFTSSVVKRIDWSPGSVSLWLNTNNNANETVRGKKCLVTVPLSILQADHRSMAGIEFRPEITAIRNAASLLAMGSVIKIVLQFREPFWQSLPGLHDMSFLHSDDEWFPTWWTALPAQVPQLTGWVGGPRATKLMHCTPEFVVDRAIQSLATIFEFSAGHLFGLIERSYFHDWNSDPCSLGAYSYVPAGAWNAAQQIAGSLDRTLYFAGEAADFEGRWGTVHGAMASGQRAAKKILAEW
jgi:monoamine oxidase